MSVIGWTFIAAVAAVVLVVWITARQPALPADCRSRSRSTTSGSADAFRAVGAIRPRGVPRLSRVFLVVLALVVAATLASALAWSGVGLIAFVPLVGLAVFPLQLVALLLRGLVFEYLGLAARARTSRSTAGCRVPNAATPASASSRPRWGRWPQRQRPRRARGDAGGFIWTRPGSGVSGAIAGSNECPRATTVAPFAMSRVTAISTGNAPATGVKRWGGAASLAGERELARGFAVLDVVGAQHRRRSGDERWIPRHAGARSRPQRQRAIFQRCTPLDLFRARSTLSSDTK